MIQEFDAGTLKQRLESGETMVILVYGATCGPCIKSKPNYEMVANFFHQLHPTLPFGQINIWDDANRIFKEHTPVESVPTFIIYKRGIEVSRIKGYQDALPIKSFVFEALTQFELLSEN
jgi:thioredoxin-like negative regulator of GroEL